MAQTTGSGEPETVGLPTVGAEGEVCVQCGSALATDQRYCLNCGWRRGDPRVDYERRMTNGVQPAAVAQPQGGASFAQSPIFAVGTIALLGIMLLLGVLIGKDDDSNPTTVAAPAPAATTTTAAAPPTETTAAAPTAGNKAPKGAAAGQGNVEQGGSGSTEGVQQVDTAALENAARSGQGAQAGKNLPNQVATGGDQEAVDPEGIKNAGGGSGGGACIGC
jgi:hypothetical protein